MVARFPRARFRAAFSAAVMLAAVVATATARAEPALELHPRPQPTPLWCTPRICIHGPPETAPSARSIAETAAEALAALVDLGLPRPLPDGGAGGTLALDLYLDAGGRRATAYPDLPAPTDLARSAAFGVVGLGPGPRCARDHDVARAVAQAMLLGLDSAVHDGALAMHATYLASLVRPCRAVELAAVDEAQRAPERALVSWPRDQPSGAWLLPRFLDVAYGTALDGDVMSGLVAISVQPRGDEPGSLRNEPDLFDALREVLPPRGTDLPGFLLDFAVARAFVGSRSDGTQFPTSAWMGSAGRVRHDWAVDYASLPRRLAPIRPVDPTGASYIWIDLRDQGPKTGVRLIADWETSHVMSWSLVKLDADGKRIGRLDAGGVFGRDRVDVSLVDAGEAASVIVVGSHAGNDDRSRPYDPDRGPPRPTSYEVTLHPL